jgi:hypothetical protein
MTIFGSPIVQVSPDVEREAIQQYLTSSTTKVGPVDMIEYAGHLQRLLDITPGLTVADLAAKLSRPTHWVQNLLTKYNLKVEIKQDNVVL